MIKQYRLYLPYPNPHAAQPDIWSCTYSRLEEALEVQQRIEYIIGNGPSLIFPKAFARLRWQLICKRIDTFKNPNMLQTMWRHRKLGSNVMFTRPVTPFLNRNQSNH